MERNSIARIKCAMIAYELERSLGRYVREKNKNIATTPTAKDILQRSGQTQIDENESARFVIENSYLGEIFSLAQTSAKSTSDEVQFLELERLITSLKLFDIRNAVSHPNRPFPDCYWYRCAAIAADPSIDSLGFYEVTLAFHNAEDGKLQEPPDDWMFKKRWSVPSILPSEFEHSVTGLFGRSKETGSLLKEIKNKRAPLIALVATGGVGKTSLLLQVVSDFCLSTEASNHIDCVLWTSLKQEKLTIDGIQILSAPVSLQEMQIDLCSSATEILGDDFLDFDQMKERLRNKRVLLCLDNLETLLRDSPAEFNKFYEDLPEDWKVIVTSRIPVDSAKNIPLGTLDSQGASALARAYFASRGHGNIENDVLDKVCAGSKRNPLAIRLTIELYLAGSKISEALERSEREVLSFSFTNLLDTLSELENNVLETIFALESPTRSDICGSLTCAVDEVAEAIAKLSKTSLITRHDDESIEAYLLGDSIRDLLRSNPRNLAVRSKSAEWLRRSKETAESAIRLQAERETSPVDLNYIPLNTPASLIYFAKQIKAAIKREDRSALVDIENSLRNQIAFEPENSFRHRLYARVVLELDDIPTAIQQFSRASVLAPSDPAPLFGLMLAYQHTDKGELLKTSTTLIESEWGDPAKSGLHHANRIWGLHLHAACIAGKFTDVFDSTQDWEVRLKTMPCFALSRASAYRRQADLEVRNHEADPRRLGSLLGKACRLMQKTLISENFAKWIFPELRKLVSELDYYQSRKIDPSSFDTDDQSAVINLLTYCREHGTNSKSWAASDLLPLIQAYSGEKVENLGEDATPLLSAKFKDQGYVCGKIKQGMKSDASYVFVQDDAGTDYFVHLDVFEGGDWRKKRHLAPGVDIAIKFDPNPTGNALRATEAWLV